MKLILSVLVAIFLVPCCAWSLDLDAKANYDEAWRKTVQTIALEGIDITMKDKDTGIIQGSKPSDADSKYFTCPQLRGRAESYSINISATVNEKTESSSVVSILVEGKRKSYLNKHFAFITVGRSHEETKCESTGELERILSRKISHQNK